LSSLQNRREVINRRTGSFLSIC